MAKYKLINIGSGYEIYRQNMWFGWTATGIIADTESNIAKSLESIHRYRYPFMKDSKYVAEIDTIEISVRFKDKV